MVRLTEIIPAIRTDHDAILLEIGKLENGQNGPGYWKLNCSLLADDAYVNSITELLPLWAAEGRKELTDHRSVWDWIKYNMPCLLLMSNRNRPKVKWCSLNDLLINPTKTKLLLVGTLQMTNSLPTDFKLDFLGKQIFTPSSSGKDLGVVIDSHLTYI